MNKEFSDWYDSYPNGEPSYQETFEAGQSAILAKLRAGVEVPEPALQGIGWSQGYFAIDQLLAYGAAQRLAAAEQDKADAERYRWLRDSDSEHARVMTYIEGLDEWLAYSTAEDIDAAVDQKRGEA